MQERSGTRETGDMNETDDTLPLSVLDWSMEVCHVCKYWSVLTVLILGLQGKRFDQDVGARDCKVCVWAVGVDVVFPVNRKRPSKEVKSSCNWGKSYSTLFE